MVLVSVERQETVQIQADAGSRRSSRRFAAPSRRARLAQPRNRGGVPHERVIQPIDHPLYMLVELEFASLEEAQRFQEFLQARVWSTPANSPARAGSPHARIAETASVGPG